jgi:MoaA/NifB/PqqE/SkfB family radical SAM enzyme
MVVEADGRVRPCFFHAPAGDVRAGLGEVRGSADYRSRLRALRAPNAVCERCVCPKWLGPEGRA